MGVRSAATIRRRPSSHSHCVPGACPAVQQPHAPCRLISDRKLVAVVAVVGHTNTAWLLPCSTLSARPARSTPAQQMRMRVSTAHYRKTQPVRPDGKPSHTWSQASRLLFNALRQSNRRIRGTWKSAPLAQRLSLVDAVPHASRRDQSQGAASIVRLDSDSMRSQAP